MNTQVVFERILVHGRRHRFTVLLISLVLLFLAVAVGQLFGPGNHPRANHVLIAVVFNLLLLSAANAVSNTTRAEMLNLLLAAPAIVLCAASAVSSHHVVLLASYVASSSFLIYVVVALLRYLFRVRRVTGNVLSASLCTYLLIGLVWANVYSLIEAVQPGSFAYPLQEAAGEHHGAMRFGTDRSLLPTYFSLVTLTTLGYGDVVPRSSPARIFASLEAVIGQIYLAVLVARLVGLHIAHSVGRRRREPNR